MAVAVDIKDLLQAGAHFGHKTSRWHPKMGQYIHSKRAGSHIIDLTKTVEGLEAALPFITKSVASGKQVLFVGTKRQAKDIVRAAAEEVKMPFVTERWMGGMLTNVATTSARIKHLKSLESRMLSGELAGRYNKLEIQRFQEEIDLLNQKYGGIKDLNGQPGVVFVTDVVADENAVKEARRLKVPVVAIVDTNADPAMADYVIPANDDAIKSLQLITDYVKQAVAEGVASRKGAGDKKGE
ncbi:MAG TPA: 30S ribosomal protein S2 [Candidatus Saccharimonadales bacterium]|nr:30S ribosomal protein S2 [Candidatus Saccharimonadales bacterium]